MTLYLRSCRVLLANALGLTGSVILRAIGSRR